MEELGHRISLNLLAIYRPLEMRKRRCRFCNREATLLIRQANLPLCEEHFVSWFERRVERTMRRYYMVGPGERVLVAVSGGKDSLALLCVLTILSERMGFEVVGLTLDLGIKGNSYSERSVKMARRASEELGVEHIVVSVKERYGFSLPEALKADKRPPCSLCGLMKRYAITDIAREKRFDALATGHTLDDMACFILTSYITGAVRELVRLTPVVRPGLPGLPKLIKPFYESLEEHIRAYADFKGLTYMPDGCPYASTAPSDRVRAFLDQLESVSPGMKHSLVRNYIKHIRPALHAYLKESLEPLRACSKCGMPSSGEICAFCRLRERVLQRLRR